MNNTIFKLIAFGIILLGILGLACFGQVTTFTFQFYNSDGSPNTNPAILAPYPPAQNLVVVGTNLVFARSVTLVPGTNGYGTNAAWANTYRLTITNGNGGTIQAYVNLPFTGSVLPLASYISNAPAIYTPATLYAFLTNGLGGPPGLVQALQFQPMTNSAAGVTNVFTLNTLTNLLGLNGVTNLVGYNGATNLAGMAGFSGTISNAAAGITYRSTYLNGTLTATNTP